VNEVVNITPRGQISPLEARGEVKNGPLLQMNKSERAHLEAIQTLELVTCSLADSKDTFDKNGNDLKLVCSCSSAAFVHQSISPESCSKCLQNV
jgi:hypothetical protein